MPTGVKVKIYPLVVLIGRTNGGKSTLFNRLVGKRYAIEGKEANLTRDVRTHVMDGIEFVDLPGLESAWLTPKAGQEQWKTILQSFVEKADLFLWVVDGKAPWQQEDRGLFRHIGRTPWIGVVNKIDSDQQQMTWEAHASLPRGTWVYVSAAHKRGTLELADYIRERVASRLTAPPAERFQIAVVGRTNVGKSSFCNQALGEQRVRVEDERHTTRDQVQMLWPLLDSYAVVLLDTAGMLMSGKRKQTRTSSVSELQSRRAIERCECAFFMLDAAVGIADIDVRIYHLLKTAYTSVIIIVNKWDIPDRVWSSQRCARGEIEHALNASHPLIFHSTKAEFNPELFKRLIRGIIDERSRQIPTSKMNAWVSSVKCESRFDTVQKSFRMKYAVQKGTNPQRIYCFGKLDTHISHAKLDQIRRSILRSFSEFFEVRYGPVFFSIRKQNKPNHK